MHHVKNAWKIMDKNLKKFMATETRSRAQILDRHLVAEVGIALLVVVVGAPGRDLRRSARHRPRDSKQYR